MQGEAYYLQKCMQRVDSDDCAEESDSYWLARTMWYRGSPRGSKYSPTPLDKEALEERVGQR